MPFLLTGLGGRIDNLPQPTAPQELEDNSIQKKGVNESTTPLPRTTGGVVPNTPTVSQQDSNTAANQKGRNEHHIYLTTGEDTNHQSVYTPPSQGSITSTHKLKSRTEAMSAMDQPYSTDTRWATQSKSLERPLSIEEQEEGYWFMYGVKHGSQQAQIHDYAHRKALTFLKDHMNKPHPTPEEVSPIYIGWVEKASQLYQQKKDEWKPSAQTSTQHLCLTFYHLQAAHTHHGS